MIDNKDERGGKERERRKEREGDNKNSNTMGNLVQQFQSVKTQPRETIR